jgi:hypothetical protein
MAWSWSGRREARPPSRTMSSVLGTSRRPRVTCMAPALAAMDWTAVYAPRARACAAAGTPALRSPDTWPARSPQWLPRLARRAQPERADESPARWQRWQRRGQWPCGRGRRPRRHVVWESGRASGSPPVHAPVSGRATLARTSPAIAARPLAFFPRGQAVASLVRLAQPASCGRGRTGGASVLARLRRLSALRSGYTAHRSSCPARGQCAPVARQLSGAHQGSRGVPRARNPHGSAGLGSVSGWP